MFREIFVLGEKIDPNWPEVSMYMKGSAAKQEFTLYTYDYARHTISHLHSCSLPIFLSIYQRTKSLRTSRLKLLAVFRKRTLIVADKS